MNTVPTTEPAKRIALLFNRRLTTSWSEKEIRVYKKLVKAHCFESLDDLSLIERYYASERGKGDTGKHRRDLYTFVGNFHGELDRARAWKGRCGNTRNGNGAERSSLGTATTEDFRLAGELARREVEKLRQLLRPTI